MTTIRSATSVPTLPSRRVPPVGNAHGSQDRPPRQDRQLPVPTAQAADTREERGFERARPASAELVVQILAGPERRGLKADRGELERYRRTYAQTSQKLAPLPRWERRA